MAFFRAQMRAKQSRINQISMGEPSPEKAGVGGSIPSLATILSIAYKRPKTQFHSISFQNYWLIGFAFVE